MSVRAAKPQEYRAALKLLFSHLPHVEQEQNTDDLLAAEHKGELSFDGLHIVLDGSHVVGSIFCLVQPDRTAFIWPPAIERNVPGPGWENLADQLLQEAGHFCDESDAWAGQCLVAPDQLDDRERLQRNGFPHLTDLKFLARPLAIAIPDQNASLNRAEISTVWFNERSNRDRFSDILRKTYVGTQDCPEISRLRTSDDALLGHRFAGVHDPHLWKIYCIDGQDAGVLLMTNQPEQQAWEVVYVGVDPAFRRQGLGEYMLKSALHEAEQAARRHLLLAVDVRNTGALHLYAKLGFVESLTRSVYLRSTLKNAQNG